MTDSHAPADQWRVDFDAEVEFSNGGGLRVRGFRLDIPGSGISDSELGELFVRHLGLLMVGTTTVTRKEVIKEPHKGGRAVVTATGARRVADLSGPEGAPLTGRPVPLPGLVDLPGVVIRVLGSGSGTVDRPALVPFDVAGRAVLVHSAGQAQLTPAAARWLAEQGAALVGTDTDHPGPAGEPLVTAGVPVATGLRGLEALPPAGFRVHAVPYPPTGGTALARIYAVIDE